MRYSNESKEKSNGIVYTPSEMAFFLCDEMIRYSMLDIGKLPEINILDPAVGGGELLDALIHKLNNLSGGVHIKAVGYETDASVAEKTQQKLQEKYPFAEIRVFSEDFLDAVEGITETYQFVIANPPYVRTQILGAERAQEIARKMYLKGRVDIYYAFLLYMKKVLSHDGIAGYITSNKFFTIRAGASVRKYMLDNYRLHSVVDFGDTKLFTASVLPCIVVFSLGKTQKDDFVSFSSVYEENEAMPIGTIKSVFERIGSVGAYKLKNGRNYNFQHGVLKTDGKDSVWTLSSDEKQRWLRKVEANTWIHFSDIGKIRVGIKTTADNVFIGDDWTGDKADLEWLQPLITHRDAGQIVSGHSKGWKVLYTHTMLEGKKTVLDIDQYPKTKAYLETHYDQLAGRKYLQKAHRNWYEIWVPQNPAAWASRKIVFRDISERPEFWLDETGAVVNGDCYWIDIDDSIFEDTVYLALAVANSKFIEKYYDIKFNTKLYSGKRRFMSQYVEQFPIPFANTEYAHRAIDIVKKIIAGHEGIDIPYYMGELNKIVDAMFTVG